MFHRHLIIGGYGAGTINGDNGNDTLKYLSLQDDGDTLDSFEGGGVAGGDVLDLQDVLDDDGTVAGIILDANAGEGNDTSCMSIRGVEARPLALH
jgi:hypothetical protein